MTPVNSENSGRLRASATPIAVRDHNERLVLSIVQRHGPIASAEIARRALLSAQTVSVITRSLEAAGLLMKGAPVRGKVGKPLTPMRLNPDGVFSYGLRIGRRSADLILMNFAGEVRGHLKATFPYPTPERVTRFAEDGLKDLEGTMSLRQRARIVGIGIAAPFELWNWLDIVDAPKSEMGAWQDFDFKQAFRRFTTLPILVGNDTTLACCGEHVFGNAHEKPDFGYFYVGSFVGGGMVLDGKVYTGASGNAGAFGSIPVGERTSPNRQLIHNASVFVLEKMLETAGFQKADLWDDRTDWAGFDRVLSDWLSATAMHLATACVSVAAILNIPLIIIDGGFPDHVRARLVCLVAQCLSDVDTRGVTIPKIAEGRLGHMAGALGSAYQPILAEYLIDGSGLV